MNHDQDDRQFEDYLRKFRPEAPKPLPGRGQLLLLRWRAPAFAAAAVGALIALALLAWLRGPVEHRARLEQPAPARSTIVDEVSLRRLSTMANQDPAKLDDHLDRISPKLLPDVRKGHGVLRTLSVE